MTIFVILGRTNVGKSTLFNKLINTKKALVNKSHGVTRDFKESNVNINNLKFSIIDTPGFDNFKNEYLPKNNYQYKKPIIKANLILFLIDGTEGIIPIEKEFINYLRSFEKKIILIINKSEKRINKLIIHDIYNLGIETVIPISAAYNQGIQELLIKLSPYIKSTKKTIKKIPTIQVAVSGRPNTGKSTLINKLINDKRLLTGPETGLTRDTIEINWSYEGRQVKLIDTAGLRRKFLNYLFYIMMQFLLWKIE